MSQVIKPPLGIMPYKLWIESRISELNETYERTGNWIEENTKNIDRDTKIKYVTLMLDYLDEMNMLDTLLNHLTN